MPPSTFTSPNDRGHSEEAGKKVNEEMRVVRSDRKRKRSECLIFDEETLVQKTTDL